MGAADPSKRTTDQTCDDPQHTTDIYRTGCDISPSPSGHRHTLPASFTNQQIYK